MASRKKAKPEEGKAAVTVADLKARAKKAEPVIPDAAPVEEAPARNLSPQMRSTIQGYARDAAALETQGEDAGRVDLGEIPEEVKEARAEEEKQNAPQSNVVYSYTAYDRPEVRKAVEARCEPLDDFSDLLTSGRVIQSVPIIDERLNVIYQSLIGAETWFAQRLAMSKFNSRQEAQTWNGYARLALSVMAVNGAEYPPAYNEKKELDEKLLTERVDLFLKLPEHLVNLMLVNLGWFEDRVEQLFKDDFELLKNG